MTTTTVPRAGARRDGARAVRRVAALARAETTLLVRNRTALLNALLLPVALVGLFTALTDPAGSGADLSVVGGSMLAMLAATALLFVVYLNLTSAYVARREDRVLQRLLTGESTRGQILLAPALPAVLLTFAQMVLGWTAIALLLDPPGLTNPLLVLAGVGGGAAVMALLAVPTSAFSRTVESVQLTTLPVFVLVLPFAGIFTVPGDDEGLLGTISRFTPLRPVVELCWLGFSGTAPDGSTLTFAETFAAAGLPVAVLAGWIALGVLAARTWMRWEPRR